MVVKGCSERPKLQVAIHRCPSLDKLAAGPPLEWVGNAALLRRSGPRPTNSSHVDVVYRPCACLSHPTPNQWRSRLGTFTFGQIRSAARGRRRVRCLDGTEHEFTQAVPAPLFVLRWEVPTYKPGWYPGSPVTGVGSKDCSKDCVSAPHLGLVAKQVPYPSSVVAWNGRNMTDAKPPSRRTRLAALFANSHGLFNRGAEPLRSRLEAECKAAIDCIGLNKTNRHGMPHASPTIPLATCSCPSTSLPVASRPHGR